MAPRVAYGGMTTSIHMDNMPLKDEPHATVACVTTPTKWLCVTRNYMPPSILPCGGEFRTVHWSFWLRSSPTVPFFMAVAHLHHPQVNLVLELPIYHLRDRE